MKAFISYSFNDRELNLLSLIFTNLKRRRYDIVSTGYVGHSLTSHDIFMIQNQIKSAHIFIGILTKSGKQKQNVLFELDIARRFKIPHLLLIEKGINLRTTQNINIIRFNRQDPHEAIDIINRTRNGVAHSTMTNDNTLAWLIGAAALIVIISLLTKKE